MKNINSEEEIETYTDSKDSSAEKEKKSKKYSGKSILIILISLVAAVGTITAGCLYVRHQRSVRYEQYVDNVVEAYKKSEAEDLEKRHGFSYIQIGAYAEEQALNLLRDNEMFDYEEVDDKRNYNYTSEDFKNVQGLSDKYILGFYYAVSSKNLDDICKALGYNDFSDMLKKKGFDGDPDCLDWTFAESYSLADQMYKEGLANRK